MKLIHLTMLVAMLLVACQGEDSSTLADDAAPAAFNTNEWSLVAIERGSSYSVRGFTTASAAPKTFYYEADPSGDNQYDLTAIDCSVNDAVVYVFDCRLPYNKQLVVTTQPLAEGEQRLADATVNVTSFLLFRFEPNDPNGEMIPLKLPQ